MTFSLCALQNEYFEYGDQAAEPEFNHDILYRAGANQRVRAMTLLSVIVPISTIDI
jgi:hypothetical protein